MIEGLAVWTLLIYILRLVGMPWNKGTKLFSFAGGGLWLLFVWVGLLNYTPMDMSGGSVVQSPHIQLRPASTQITGNVKAIYVEPNQRVSKGELIYELEDAPYRLSVVQSRAELKSKSAAIDMAVNDVAITKHAASSLEDDAKIAEARLLAANQDLDWKNKTGERYKTQNKIVPNTVTESKLDQQQAAINQSIAEVVALDNNIDKIRTAQIQAQQEIEKAITKVTDAQAEHERTLAALKQAEWNLEHTKIYAPADGYVTNFIMREGQYVGAAPRIHMYTDEKYVLMRVNHQALRNVRRNQRAEFTSAIYPGKIFNATVEGIIEATGESQGSLVSVEAAVRNTTVKNAYNKHHFVRLKIDEAEGSDVPVGAVGLAWISGEKPIAFMAFLDVVRGIIIRMKSQIYYFYSL